MSKVLRVRQKDREQVLDMVKAGRPKSQIARALEITIPTLNKHFKAELAGTVRYPGTRGPKDYTEQERASILSMASYGIPMDEIARCFDTTRFVLAEHFGDELLAARTRLHANIARSLVRSALVGNNVTAQIFLAKTRLRWSERIELAHEGSIETGATDVDIEEAVASMSKKARDALRTLAEEAKASAPDEPAPEARIVH